MGLICKIYASFGQDHKKMCAISCVRLQAKDSKKSENLKNSVQFA